jgi:hypothetical protein
MAEDSIVQGLEAVAQHFGKSTRQVRRWIAAGMPRLSGKRFDVLQIQDWLDRRQGLEAPGARARGGDPRQWNLPEESGKDFWDKEAKKWQARHRELEFKKRQGELVERLEVEQLFVARIMAVKQALLTLSRALPPQLATCSSEREMEPIISRAVRDILSAFARPLPESFAPGEAPRLPMPPAENGTSG